jgi:hypothetical protein
MGQILGSDTPAATDNIQRATIIKTLSDLHKITEINGVSLQGMILSAQNRNFTVDRIHQGLERSYFKRHSFEPFPIV